MNLQWILLLVFICGAVSAWLVIRTSRRVYEERIAKIKTEIKSKGGIVIDIKEVKRNDFPFSEEYKEKGLVYKFYRISYDMENELKKGWAILGMKQSWYGPGGAIDSNWLWRL